MKKCNFEEIWGRIQEATDVIKLTKLAEVAGTSPQNISNRKNNNSFMLDWGYEISKKYNLNLEWIMEGTGPMRPGGEITEDEKIISEIKEWLNELTTEDKRKKIWFEIQFEEKFPEFKEWFKKRNSDSQHIVPQKKTA